MKNLARFIFLALIVSAFFVVGGCKNSIEEQSYEKMIAEFDGKYFLPEPIKYEPYSVFSSNFNPKDMLEPSYVFPQNYYIDLDAPDDCTTYSWQLMDSEGIIQNPPLCSKKTFHHDASKDFKVGEENILILTVTVADSQGNTTEYIDESVIIIKAQKNLDLKE